MPKYEQVKVQRGDLGSKFFVMDEGIDGGGNRTINTDRVKAYAATLDDFESIGELDLIKREDGGYWIADGQHRITAISTFAERPYKVWARVSTLSEIHGQGLTVPQYLTKINSGLAHSAQDSLAIYAPSSLWVRYAEHLGLNVTFKKRVGTSTHLNWTDIMYARHYADEMIRHDAPKFNRLFTSAQALDLFLTRDQGKIKETIEALKWWSDGHEKACKRRIRSLGHRYSLAIAIVTYRKNKRIPAFQEAPRRLAESGNLEMVRRITGGEPIHRVYEPIVAGMNHNQKRHLVNFFGYTGRE